MIIYKATNKLNGKCYIGQTRHSLEDRKKGHLHSVRSGVNTRFYQAIRKYGADNFEWEIVCSASDKDTLNELETYYINKYDSVNCGYNMIDGGENNIMDVEEVKTKHDLIMQSAKVRNQISQSMKRYRAEHPFTAEHRKKLSEKAKGNHNFGSSDTRSIGCYCILETGEVKHFHSYRDAWHWWATVPNVFNTKTECVYQRKIKQSIALGYFTYGKDGIKHEYPKWFKGGEMSGKKVTDT